MKVVQSVLLAVSLLGPAVTSVSAQADVSVYAEDYELLDAAGALGYRARVVLDKVTNLSATDPNSDLDKAARLSRFINVEANEMVNLIENSASEDVLLDKLQVLEDYVLQLDATKRQLQKRYPRDTQLRNSLNDVRRTYYYLKQLLTGEA